MPRRTRTKIRASAKATADITARRTSSNTRYQQERPRGGVRAMLVRCGIQGLADRCCLQAFDVMVEMVEDLPALF